MELGYILEFGLYELGCKWFAYAHVDLGLNGQKKKKKGLDWNIGSDESES